jgi:hypothetical protein
MIFDHFGHDAVDRATSSGEQTHHFGEPGIVFNGAVEGLNLAGEPSDPV